MRPRFIRDRFLHKVTLEDLTPAQEDALVARIRLTLEAGLIVIAALRKQQYLRGSKTTANSSINTYFETREVWSCPGISKARWKRMKLCTVWDTSQQRTSSLTRSISYFLHVSYQSSAQGVAGSLTMLDGYSRIKHTVMQNHFYMWKNGVQSYSSLKE
jgi:hypothetical protein